MLHNQSLALLMFGFPMGLRMAPETLVPRFKGGAIQIGIIRAGKQKKRYTLIKQTNNNVQCIW